MDGEAEEVRTVAVLITRPDGSVLGVSRKDDKERFSLPGGHVEDGETYEEAAARELMEETGLQAEGLSRVYEAQCDGTHCVTFSARAEGEVHTDEPGVVKWCRPSELAYGAFGEYNQDLFNKVGILY